MQIMYDSFSNYLDVLPTFTLANTTGYLWSICLVGNILKPFP